MPDQIQYPPGKHKDLTDIIIRGFYNVYNTLGQGFLESVYQKAMVIELRKLGLQVQPQARIGVFYQSQQVGSFITDILVNDLVIVELKAAKTLTDDHKAQLLNYLKGSQQEVGLLLNFGPKAEISRKVFDNDQKGNLSWIKKKNNS